MEKKKIEAKIIADSRNEFGNRITSFILTFPRFILAELNTHRMFSRNSASSRAIPFEKMVKMVEKDPFIPIAWQKDHFGMQGTEYFKGTCEQEFLSIDRCFGYASYKDKPSTALLKDEWLEARDCAVAQAKSLSKLGVTKQLCNRLLEPFLWHTALVTATEYDNFFELRCPKYEIHSNLTLKEQSNPVRVDTFKSKKDLLNEWKIPKEMTELDWIKMSKSGAEIHIQALAEAMWDAMNESTPKQLESGEWHIPFGENIDSLDSTTNKSPLELLAMKMNYTEMAHSEDMEELAIKIATARCARLSYMTFDGDIDYEKDIALHDQLLDNKHMSPFEHCARAMSPLEYKNFSKLTLKSKDATSDENTLGVMADGGTKVQRYLGWCNNFQGFIPYRYLIENEG